MNNLKHDLRYPIVLRYFEAIEADDWNRVSAILGVAEKDKQLEDAIMEAHEGLDWESDTPLVQQVQRRYEKAEEGKTA